MTIFSFTKIKTLIINLKIISLPFWAFFLFALFSCDESTAELGGDQSEFGAVGTRAISYSVPAILQGATAEVTALEDGVSVVTLTADFSDDEIETIQQRLPNYDGRSSFPYYHTGGKSRAFCLQCLAWYCFIFLNVQSINIQKPEHWSEKTILGLNLRSTTIPSGGKGRVHTHTSVSMGILSTPISSRAVCLEISSRVSWFPHEIIFVNPRLADRSRLVIRLLFSTSLSRDWFSDTSSSFRLFRPQTSSSSRRFLLTSSVFNSQLVHSRYLKEVFADRLIPERGFRVMEKESRFIKAARPVRSAMPEGGIIKASIDSASS